MKVYIVIIESKRSGCQHFEKAFDTERKALDFADKLRDTIGDRFKVLWQKVDLE